MSDSDTARKAKFAQKWSTKCSEVFKEAWLEIHLEYPTESGRQLAWIRHTLQRIHTEVWKSWFVYAFRSEHSKRSLICVQCPHSTWLSLKTAVRVGCSRILWCPSDCVHIRGYTMIYFRFGNVVYVQYEKIKTNHAVEHPSVCLKCMLQTGRAEAKNTVITILEQPGSSKHDVYTRRGLLKNTWSYLQFYYFKPANL